ncbi:helix-turn-helix transcriptional regulator [Paenibacillus tyrfis]|uniref:HTH araC/xylS-type domain-containing protein n=1 Tax=Paenibacillus tyrfis TaxID=1501230 RepID=A0A081NXH8_9BACL|nr:AraC family transcriptional regulator [Paenibacillus tyrfis]KEQ23151.1 hypothetical protein ET33_17420 [Paenibacillus tyrfis]
MKKQTISNPFTENFTRISDSLCGSGHVKEQTESIAYLSPFWGTGCHRRVCLREGLELDYSEMLLGRRLSIESTVRRPMLELALNIDSGADWFVDGHKTEFPSRGGNAHLVYMNQVKYYADLPENKQLTHLELRFDPVLWNEFLHDLKIRPEQRFVCMEAPISPAMRAVAQQLACNPYRGMTERLYMEGKALELLALYLRAAEAVTKPSSCLKPCDVKCIHEARDILIHRLDHPPSLVQLARMVHINEQKLKSGFKEVFGTTVFGFIRQQRLEKAKQLLEMDKISVSEASSLVGYSNFSHFASLFRKTYGFNPSLYGKNNNL